VESVLRSAEISEKAKTRWGSSVTCGVLGWVLDAYDFFVLVFLLNTLAAHFSVSKQAIIATITATLFMRPIGALIVGLFADNRGRKYPLLLCVLYFSFITALTPFAPNYVVFLILRALYGIGMGGYWGVGAALVVESSPIRLRGFFSGLLQAGYSIGYLLAALASRTLGSAANWKWMFLCGLPVALTIAALLLWTPDVSRTVTRRGVNLRKVFGTLQQHWRSFVFLTLFMTGITCLSHGTQDLYPDFLVVVHRFDLKTVANVAVLYNVGAILGAVVIGRVSDRLGRRNSIYLALAICALAVPAWAFGKTATALTLGAIIMQFGVQGAFGVIPAYLNELSPADTRTLFPGLVYQFGVLFGAPCVLVEYVLRNRLGYSWALAVFEAAVIVCLALMLRVAREQHRRELYTG
jgi:MFS transporter, SHS family, lactate transporter